jgi:RsiW-degrading membrane proteinase PrsW (M82 family)
VNLNNPVLLSAMAAAPGLAICIFIYWKDKFDPEPRRLLINCFFWGALSCFTALTINNILEVFIFLFRLPIEFHYAGTNLFWSLLSCILGTGLVEEYSKFLSVKAEAYRKPEFDEPFDGITYSVMVAMGFATLENFLYVFEYGFEVAVIRMFLSVPAHAVFGVIIGYHMGLQKFSGKKYLALKGILLAAVLHGFFNFFLLNSYIKGLYLGAIVSLIIGLIYSLRAIKLHSKASPFKHPKGRAT